MDLSKYVGETSSYEKKEMLEGKKPNSWLKSVSAFANTKGGKIFFGINDNDEIVGLKDSKKDSEIISEMIKTKLDPIPKIDLQVLNKEGKNFIVLTIFAGDQTPYYVIDNNSGRTSYIRIGNESVKSNSAQLTNLTLKGMNKTFDTLLTSINKSKVSFLKLESMFYKQTGNELTNNDFISFGILEETGYLTNAGALLADEKLIYQSRIFATRWNGLDKTNGIIEALDDKEFEGGLLYLLESGKDFIKTNSKKMWKKDNEHRIEYPDYPERAIQEALVNALIHRDYTIIGSEIHIDIYDDRIEIYSPGGMIDGSIIQEQGLYQISSKRRNPLIADIFSRMNLMERRGSGFEKILNSYKIQKNYTENLKPQFHSNESSFFIILKNLNYNSDTTTSSDKVAISSDKVAISSDNIQEQVILNWAKEYDYFRSKDIEKLINVKSARARKILLKMVENNLLISIGQNRNRKYKVKK
nr:ATP-binding protein [Mycoplasmopsis canis]WQQ12567.1 ATP-binding protein [Mycoplasmopsis canis]